MQKVLFLGEYSCGLTTLVSALLKRDIHSPATDSGLVTDIVYGDDGHCFAINKTGEKECLSLNELRDSLTPLRNADYIEFNCSSQAENLAFTVAYNRYFEPEYEHNSQCLEKFLYNSDAVVYVINASRPFLSCERDFLQRFAGSKNVFFCINRMDTIEEKHVDDIKKITKESLKSIFTSNEVFDETLYQNRVFFISAYNSLNARLGRRTFTLRGYFYLPDMVTGVPEFEHSLRDFLHKNIAQNCKYNQEENFNRINNTPKVLFTGALNCGKNTLINALLRKAILPSSPVLMPEDNYITEIVSSKQDECWYANYKNGRKERLDVKKLHSMYADPETCDSTIFESIESLVVETPVQTDGLCFAVAHSSLTSQYFTQKTTSSNAIVFLINASGLMQTEEKLFIDTYLSDCNNGNIFFCVNGIDRISREEITFVEKSVENLLRPCFSRNGVFNEKLYQNRVFFVSAYNSLNARLGKPLHTPYGDIDVKDIDTGVPEFEYTLRKYLQQAIKTTVML